MKKNKEEMMTKQQINSILTAVRASLLLREPFYGHLLMKLKFGIASCGTACTDMRRILWDPEFISGLNEEEIEFVMEHEVLHCVLQHPLRGRRLNHRLYNIAADIVVNANIFYSRGIDNFKISGKEVMHLAPDMSPGHLHTAEQVYAMLLDKYKDASEDEQLFCELEAEGGTVDNHTVWKTIPMGPSLSQEWNGHIKETAGKTAGLYVMPPAARKLLKELDYKEKVDWKQLLHDFIQSCSDRYDYTFTPSDRRFSDGDFILPAFWEIEGEKLDNLWFLIDTSGSISNETLTAVFMEVKSCLEQLPFLRGKLSFFDTTVSDPVEFHEVQDLEKMKPTGGGGTSFHCIFKYMKAHMAETLPTAVIILTDGYADYPDEEAALGVPVFWMLVGRDTDAPWGKTVHIEKINNRYKDILRRLNGLSKKKPLFKI